MKESECRFTSMEYLDCKECKEKKLHETGSLKKDFTVKVKMCISCWVITRR